MFVIDLFVVGVSNQTALMSLSPFWAFKCFLSPLSFQYILMYIVDLGHSFYCWQIEEKILCEFFFSTCIFRIYDLNRLLGFSFFGFRTIISFLRIVRGKIICRPRGRKRETTQKCDFYSILETIKREDSANRCFKCPWPQDCELGYFKSFSPVEKSSQEKYSLECISSIWDLRAWEISRSPHFDTNFFSFCVLTANFIWYNLVTTVAWLFILIYHICFTLNNFS